jgi:predicted negative regulator of RcsB-dependent stress response|tara:strand:- start:1236 stop:1880 length:645 start_codon:yes stop_codon:yes gene_type:complete
MTEETQLISSDQKKIAIKDILIKNKKSIIFIIVILLIGLFGYFFYIDHKKNIKIQISEQYNSAIIGYENNNQNSSIEKMRYIIEKRDSTYSPLALYFLLDNKLLDNKSEINLYFDLLINETKLDNEVKNLIIYKKGLYNSENASEEELLSIYKPLINKENLWKSHALYVIAEYFFSKNEKQKSKEFFEKIIEMENSNPQIKIEAQKRLQRDFSA